MSVSVATNGTKQACASLAFSAIKSMRQLFFAASFILVFMCATNKTSAQATGDWQIAVDTLQVKISYNITKCSGLDRILIRVENNSTDAVSVSWNDNLVSGESSYSNASAPINKSIRIEAGKTIEGVCDQSVATERQLCLPIDLFLQGKYSIGNLQYQISGFIKSIL